MLCVIYVPTCIDVIYLSMRKCIYRINDIVQQKNIVVFIHFNPD